MGCKVLLVEDEPVIREILAEVLAEEGHAVLAAADGQEALEVAAHEPPDVVVSDVRMPRVDGLELVRRLRARGLDVPVVLVSAHYAGVDLPGVRYVPKPFDLDRVADAVAAAVADVAAGQGTGSG